MKELILPYDISKDVRRDHLIEKGFRDYFLCGGGIKVHDFEFSDIYPSPLEAPENLIAILRVQMDSPSLTTDLAEYSLKTIRNRKPLVLTAKYGLGGGVEEPSAYYPLFLQKLAPVSGANGGHYRFLGSQGGFGNYSRFKEDFADEIVVIEDREENFGIGKDAGYLELDLGESYGGYHFSLDCSLVERLWEFESAQG